MNYYRIISASLFTVIALCFCSCENNISAINMVAAADNTPLLVEQNAVIYYSDSAKPRLKLTAPVIESFGGLQPYDLFPKGVKIEFYDDSMKVNSHVTADSAIIHNNGNNKLMEADKNVVVVNKKGDELKTQQLFWDQSKHIIYTSKAVNITTPTEILIGDGLQSNEDFSDYKITNLTGTVMLKQ